MPDSAERKEVGRHGDPKPGRQRERAQASSPRSGRSGYGIDSLRPHLHDQLEFNDLLRHGKRIPARGRE